MRLGYYITAGLAMMLLARVGVSRADVSSDQPAAVLLFPRVAVDSTIGVDTLIRLGNTNTTTPLNVHCFLVDATPVCRADPTLTCLHDSAAPHCTGPCDDRWNETDFRLILTSRQPIGWLISQGMRDCRSNPASDPNRPCFQLDGIVRTGPGGQNNAGSNILPAPHDQFIGYLQCIAVDDTDTPIERNDLKGEATILRSPTPDPGAIVKRCSGNPSEECKVDSECQQDDGPCDTGGVCDQNSSEKCTTNADCMFDFGHCFVPVDADGYNAVGLKAITTKQCPNGNACNTNADCAGIGNGTCALPNDHNNTLCLGGCTPGQGTCSVTRSQSCFNNSDCPTRETCVDKCPTSDLCPVGPEYDGCANILLLDHFLDGAADPISGLSVVTDLTLVPCTQDYLRQNPNKTTVQFLVFNEFEQRFSTSTPVTCFKEFRLSNIDTTTNVKSIFSAAVNGTLTGQTRIRGVALDDPSHGDTLIGVAREFRCGPGSTLAACNVVSTSAFNLHSQGRRPEVDLIYLPPN